MGNPHVGSAWKPSCVIPSVPINTRYKSAYPALNIAFNRVGNVTFLRQQRAV